MTAPRDTASLPAACSALLIYSTVLLGPVRLPLVQHSTLSPLQPLNSRPYTPHTMSLAPPEEPQHNVADPGAHELEGSNHTLSRPYATMVLTSSNRILRRPLLRRRRAQELRCAPLPHHPNHARREGRRRALSRRGPWHTSFQAQGSRRRSR